MTGLLVEVRGPWNFANDVLQFTHNHGETESAGGGPVEGLARKSEQVEYMVRGLDSLLQPC